MTTTVPGLSKDTATTGRLQRLLRRPLALEWRSRRCPRCGRGRLFCAFLKVDDHCSVCRLDFTGHRADDLPAYLLLAIVIVGHVLVPVILWIEVDYAPSLAFQLGIYLPISALASISLLQPVKGAVVALQWSLKMHGFGVHPPDELQALRRKVPQRNGADVRRYDAADEIAGARARFSRAVARIRLGTGPALCLRLLRAALRRAFHLVHIGKAYVDNQCLPRRCVGSYAASDLEGQQHG